MIHWFGRLPSFETSPAGLERTVLWLVPRLFLYGTLMVISPSLFPRIYAVLVSTDEIGGRWLASLDMGCISMLILLWGSLLLAALSAFIVMVMKGPAYVADAYYLTDKAVSCACCGCAAGSSRGRKPNEQRSAEGFA